MFDASQIQPRGTPIHRTSEPIAMSPISSAADSFITPKGNGAGPLLKGVHQAWPVPQCGQATDVDTAASNT